MLLTKAAAEVSVILMWEIREGDPRENSRGRRRFQGKKHYSSVVVFEDEEEVVDEGDANVDEVNKVKGEEIEENVDKDEADDKMRREDVKTCKKNILKCTFTTVSCVLALTYRPRVSGMSFMCVLLSFMCVLVSFMCVLDVFYGVLCVQCIVAVF